jgi:predicted RNA-binding protein
MCEIRVVLEQNGIEELLMQNVTRLEVLESSVAITSLFEGSREIPNSVVRNIDFLAGKVFLQKRS